MSTTTRIFGALAALLLGLNSGAYAASIESYGQVSAGVGAERETGATSGCTNFGDAFNQFTNSGGVFTPHGCAGSPGARGMFGALGVLPFGIPDLGLQLGANYNGGAGSRFGAKLGPIYGWTGGKVGAIVDYQYRSHGSSNFFWITPAVSLYFGNFNVNLSYTQQMSSIQTKTRTPQLFFADCCVNTEMQGNFQTRYIPTNRLQGSVSYFPINSLELNLGLQVNTFAGATKDIRSAGVGPVFAVAWMPLPSLELSLVKGSFDNRSRYNVQSGLAWHFYTGSTKGNDLKEIRRKYLQTPDPSVAIAGPYTGKSFFTP